MLSVLPGSHSPCQWQEGEGMSSAGTLGCVCALFVVIPDGILLKGGACGSEKGTGEHITED